MEKFKILIKSRRNIIITCLLNLLIFYLVFKIASLDMQFYILGFEVIIFMLFLYLGFSYFTVKKSLTLKQKYEGLKEENKKLKEEKIKLKNDILEYFFLWIHQIKTPITSAKFLIKRDEIDRNLLNRQIFYIEDYTNMALTYLKITNINADMDISNVNLDEAIKQVLKKYSIVFISNSVKLNYKQINKTVISDYKWLCLMLEQIISNAAKYTINGTVSIYFDDKENALVVADTGIGILSEDIPRIFDRGYCGFNGRTNQKSSGIGLFLVKEISKKLSIDIKVESKVKHGSKFYIKFKKDKI